jgi:hypothetical protein
VKHREELVRLFPEHEDRIDQLVNTRFRAILVDLSPGLTEASCRVDAEKLRLAIDGMEQSRRERPHTLSYYKTLAHLCHLRAIRLGSALAPSEALVAVQQALTYDPSLKQAHTTRRELHQLLEQLTQQIRKAEAQLARNRNARLNDQAARIRAEIQRGLAPLKDYTESPQAKQIAEQRNNVQASVIWWRVGVAIPTDHLAERTEALRQAVATLLDLDPYTPQRALETWADLAAETSYLVDLDPGSVLLFVHRRRAGEDEPDRQVRGSAVPDVLPLIVPTLRATRQREEPIDLWFFSRQDMRLKLLAACAAFLLIMSGLLTYVDTSNQVARDRAYAQLLAAESNDQLAVMDAAADFLAHPPLSRRDARNGQVRDLYAESFVHWFVALDETNSASVQSRVSQYQTLVAKGQ